MSRVALVESMGWAQSGVDSAVEWLLHARDDYLSTSGIDPGTRAARVAALNAKIDALRAVQLNPWAHPWTEDQAHTAPVRSR